MNVQAGPGDAAARLPFDPPGAAALTLLRLAGPHRSLLMIAQDERRGADIMALVRAFAPDRRVLLFPPWDCLPYDRMPPSAAVSGHRAATLAALGDGAPCIVIATPEALVQRVPATHDPALAPVDLAVGAAFDEVALVQDLATLGYWVDERVDEPGEFSPRGGTFDIFPADEERPVRVEHAEGRITAIRAYDPASQRSVAQLDRHRVRPALEVAGGEDAHPARWNGPKVLLAELMPGAVLVLDPAIRERAEAFLELIADTRAMHAGAAGRRDLRAPAPDLYGDEALVQAALEGRDAVALDAGESEAAVPRFAARQDARRAFARFCREEGRAGRAIVLAAPDPRGLRRFARLAHEVLGAEPVPAGDLLAPPLPEGASLAAILPAGRGFRDPGGVFTVVTATDVLGSRAVRGAGAARPLDLDAEPDWRVGDLVVHRDHGIARLAGLETVAREGVAQDMIRLCFADEAVLMVPAEEADTLWRYGAEGADVSLDTLGGTAWTTRRDRVAADIAETAGRLAALAAERAGRTAATFEPPRAAYERFAGRFPYLETPGQTDSIADVLADLRSGRPMDRLLCGDVGFGKTEVALRAAAAVALAGGQVALAAPTTVLARQHAATFRRRFAGFGIEVAELSRFVAPAQARAVKEGLADGSVRIVIGTHAIAGKGVAFKELGLVVIDEEQRFGEAHKARLRALADGGHVLAMTATPIPRTLQSALSGLRDLSVIATAPVSRRPVRTTVEAFSSEALAGALLRERARDGQSFVVCPTIEDLEPMRERIAQACPDFEIIALHAKMAPAAIDEAMLRFAEGEGHCLLATNIVESGLDVPNANTMVVWRPDRFGLAQLHQLRGRVGRGRATGFCLLLTPEDAPLTGAARRRLQTIAALDRPGAGFAISTRDLDLRGAGDLFGADQSGHLSLIGTGLARHLAEEALRRARGEAVEEDWRAEIAVADPGHLPEDYVPEAEVRLGLLIRLAGLRSAAEVDDFGDELEDRFGALPDAAKRLVGVAALAARARSLGIARIDCGPQAVAASLRAEPDAPPHGLGEKERRLGGASLAWKGGRILWARPGEPATDLARAEALLSALEYLEGQDDEREATATRA